MSMLCDSDILLTLKELLAGILLEESLVGDGAGQVINHKPENGLDLILGVTSIVSQGNILSLVSECKDKAS